MATPEYQAQEQHPKGVSIARLISSEFGSAETVVRSQLEASATIIEIDDQPWDGDRFFIPREKLIGRTISVIGPDRQWRMKYPETE